MGILLVVPIAYLIYYLITRLFVSEKDTNTAKVNYEKALKEGNRVDALNWGRKYYESLRWHNGFRLTIYDEQRIQNDINVHCKQ